MKFLHMKIGITFKSPEAIQYAMSMLSNEYDEDSQDQIKQQLKKWIHHDEYIVIEFDLENGTARVCENDKS